MRKSFSKFPPENVKTTLWILYATYSLILQATAAALLAAPVVASNVTSNNNGSAHPLHNRRFISFVPYFSDSAGAPRSGSSAKLDAETKLLNRWQADPSVGRPRRNHSESLDVTLTYNLMSMNELDEDKEVAVLHGWMEMHWVDEHLKWNKTEFGNLSRISVPADMIWKPDITMQNGASHDKTVEIFGDTNVVVSADGSVDWDPPTTLHVPLRYINTSDPWPRDRYEIKIRIGSWSHTTSEVNVLLSNESRNASEVAMFYEENARWSITNLSIRSEVEWFEFTTDKFGVILIDLKIARKPNFLLHLVDWPLKVVVISTCLLFAVPVAAVALRTLIAAVYFVIYAILVLVLEEMLPHGAMYGERMPLPVVVIVCAMILLLIDMIWIALMGVVLSVAQHQRFPRWLLSTVHRIGFALMLDPRQRADEQKIALYGRVPNNEDEEVNHSATNGRAARQASARSSWASPGDGALLTVTASEAEAVRINTSNWFLLAAVLNRIAFLTTLFAIFVLIVLTP